MFVGIDVAKDRLDVHLRPAGEAFTVARDGEGIEALVDRLATLKVELVVLEAAEGFETVVAAGLAAAGLPLAVVNPRQIRDFARATGRLAKTDPLDAAVIAHFAEAVRPQPRPVASAEAHALGERVARRRQLIEMMTAERNRRRQLTTKRLVKGIDRILWRSRPSSPNSNRTSTMPCAAPRPGARRRTSSSPCQGSARRSPAR